MTLNPGDLLFVGWDSDNNDISFVTTTEIAGGEVIYFTDNEWRGTTFTRGEQIMEWIVPDGGVSAGSVITIDIDRGSRTATIDGDGEFNYLAGGFSIASENEMFWAFQGEVIGTRAVPSNFIAVIGNEADGGSTQTPNLSGTGLTTSNGAIIIDGDEDYMEWVGDAALSGPVGRDDLVASILDTSNWVTADGNGNNNPNGTGFDIVLPPVVCFVAGARLATPDGPRPVEQLRPGDLVVTRDNGPRPLRWIGRRRVRAAGRFAPVEFLAGAIGNAAPFRVSPQHRVLLTGWRAELHFGEPEILVPAIALVDDHRVLRKPGGVVDYVHILFDRHEIVGIEGALAESLYPGPVALSGLDAAARDEVLELFPELAGGTQAYGPMARPVRSGRAVRLARQNLSPSARAAG